MTCRECAELLMDYLTGELDAEICQRIKLHLESCQHCVTYVETYQITVKLTRQMPCGELPPEVAERLRAAVNRALPGD